MIVARLESLVIARIASSARRGSATEVATALQRFAPTNQTEAAWREQVASIVSSLEMRGDGPKAIGKPGTRWAQLVDKIFPALALGIAPADTKAHARLAGRDAWTAAIAARALGLWTDGPPPSLSAVCDAYAWQQLGLAGKPKRCPPEVRAVFLQRELQTSSSPPDRLLRLYAAKQLDAPRPELRALRDALVRNWLQGRELAPRFADNVRDVARSTTSGVFGDRKVFISSVFDELRRHPTWASLTLADFKAQLVRAHRAGDVVLARADLVAAMNPDLVAASETQAEGASFHFIVREDPT